MNTILRGLTNVYAITDELAGIYSTISMVDESIRSGRATRGGLADFFLVIF